jgi:hypothetical protein
MQGVVMAGGWAAKVTKCGWWAAIATGAGLSANAAAILQQQWAWAVMCLATVPWWSAQRTSLTAAGPWQCTDMYGRSTASSSHCSVLQLPNIMVACNVDP